MRNHTLRRKATVKRIFCAALAAVFMLSGCQKVSYEQYTLKPKETLMAGTGSGAYDPTHNTAHQLTYEEIQEMNGGNAQMVFNDAGYLTFLYGKYYDGKVTDQEEAITSIMGVANLLGLAAGSEFFCVYGGQDKNGYTYFTYQQRYGDSTVWNATLHIVIDPEGTPIGLSSSFTPNLGIADTTNAITQEQAEEVVQQTYASTSFASSLVFYSEATQKMVVDLNGVTYNAYAVYTNNPIAAAQNFDMIYLEHLVAYDGTYLYGLPTSTVGENKTNADITEKYFEGLEARTWTGNVTYWDGSSRTVTLPIAYSSKDNKYYLMDLARRIAVGDYYSFMYQGYPSIDSSTDGETWNNAHLLTYMNYIVSYDFYADLGYESVDGFGTPIMILCDYCDENGTPVNNACYCGIIVGWAVFAASAANSYSEAVDVTTHEFTHGVTGYSRAGNLYQNETGAINESYSDIMGNICEMMTGYTYDQDQWLLGEMAGATMRSMSSPHDFKQPVSKSDPYYLPPTNNPSNDNDLGGVHQNSSLLAQIAYQLWAKGMSLEECRSLWLTSSEMMTPLSVYPDVYGMLLMSVDINQLDPSYKQMITDAFHAAGLLN